jgi:hypothetical protein
MRRPAAAPRQPLYSVVMPTPTATEYVFHDEQCGCGKTAIVPSATIAPCSGEACGNYTAPMSTPMPPAPVAPAATGLARYAGAATQVYVSSSIVAAVIFAGAAFIL